MFAGFDVLKAGRLNRKRYDFLKLSKITKDMLLL
jgi:hypothetical protein